MSSKFRKILNMSIYGVCAAGLIAGFAIGVGIANKWSSPLTGFFGSIGSGGASSKGAVYSATYQSEEEINAASETTAKKIIREGTVLLENDGALPLAKASKVSVFGVTSATWKSEEKILPKGNTAFTAGLSEAGLEINTTLRSFYKSNSHKNWGQGSSMGDGSGFNEWYVDETPWSEYSDDVKASFSSYNDAAIVVLSRGGCEGADLPRHMDAQNGTYDESYLSLSQNERDLLSNVDALFDKVIVVMNSANTMDMSFLKDYDINAVLLCSTTGDASLEDVGKLLIGEEDFSAKTVDTFVYNNISDNPVSNLMGDFRFTKGGELVDYCYVNYSESIYSGYRYFETRYFDKVQGQGNTSSYAYNDHVAYPFGHGLSYNEYEWSNFIVGEKDEDGNIEVSLDVKNNGTLIGKDVVEIYAYSPYTDYDKANGIEKSAVKLVGFAKTGELKAGESETVKITVNEYDLSSYDSTYEHDGVKGAYILDAGDHYLIAGRNAHSATNSILKALNDGASLEGFRGGGADSDTALVKKAFTNAALSSITMSNETTIENQFADSKLDGAPYLSRSDWSLADSEDLIYHDALRTGVSLVDDAAGHAYSHEISNELLALLQKTGWDAAGNPKGVTDFPEIKTGQDSKLTMKDLIGVGLDDSRWQELVEVLSLDQINNLFSYGGYGTIALPEIGKVNATKEYDGPARILNLFSNETSFVFPCETTIAMTWNLELAEEMTQIIGDLCIKDGISGWYAPGMDAHRTAFGGRNFEYYSEDPFLAGKMGASAVKGIQSKGVYAYIKHFALNDQDTNRGALGRYATFSTEQTIREISLRPFEISVKEGNAHGIMAAMNRVGTRQSIYHYGLLTSVLRNEWGFDGIVVTDYISGLSQDDMLAGLAAGLNLQLISQANPLDSSNLSSGAKYKLQESAKYIIYTQANSNAMNEYNYGFPLYIVYLIVLGGIILVYLGIAGYLNVKYCFFREPVGANGKFALAKADAILAISAGAVLLVLIVLLAVYFFTTALPALRQAFTLIALL